MRDWLRQSGRWLPGVAVSLIAIFVLLRLIRWQDLGPALALMRWQVLIPALVLFIISMLFRAFAWRVFLQARAPFPRVVLILNEGYLLNNLLPFRLGELGRAVLMGEAALTTPFYVLSTIILERAFDLFIAAAFLLSTLPLVFGMEWARTLAVVVLALTTTGLFFLYGLARGRSRWQPRFTRFLDRWPNAAAKIAPRLDSVLDGFGSLTRPVQFFLGFGSLLASWLLASSQYYLLLLPFAPQAAPWWAVFVLGAAAVGVAVPSAPGALGVFEASIVGALVVLGVDATSALAYAVVVHLIHYVLTGVIGVFGLYREGETLAGLYRRLLGTPTATSA